MRRSSQPLLAEVEDWGEPKQHWRVRDALAFTPKALQGDVLIKFLREEDPELRASVLLALRRLVPIYWVRHADMVSATLADRSPQVRVAALVALFHLDACDLEVQVPSIVVALRDEFWPVRAAALQTLRKLRPEQLQRLSHDVLGLTTVMNCVTVTLNFRCLHSSFWGQGPHDSFNLPVASNFNQHHHQLFDQKQCSSKQLRFCVASWTPASEFAVPLSGCWNACHQRSWRIWHVEERVAELHMSFATEDVGPTSMVAVKTHPIFEALRPSRRESKQSKR